MPKPENNMVNRILALLRDDPKTKAMKLHGGIYQERGTPDVLICMYSTEGFPRTLLLEAKQPGELPDVLQLYRLKEWAKAGAITAVVQSMEGFCDLYGKIERGEIVPGRYVGVWS